MHKTFSAEHNDKALHHCRHCSSEECVVVPLLLNTMKIVSFAVFLSPILMSLQRILLKTRDR